MPVCGCHGEAAVCPGLLTTGPNLTRIALDVGWTRDKSQPTNAAPFNFILNVHHPSSQAQHTSRVYSVLLPHAVLARWDDALASKRSCGKFSTGTMARADFTTQYIMYV